MDNIRAAGGRGGGCGMGQANDVPRWPRRLQAAKEEITGEGGPK